ncbi:hypothetical protein [Streptomyces sp. DH12]|uniref:hypothetical protein n=1 Tax=Streptomyces sp. DH12 TaxID=2857010 RepID=UPI001E3D6C2E|nr:hypothetical protein [Streptomyces sp. DH12]
MTEVYTARPRGGRFLTVVPDPATPEARSPLRRALRAAGIPLPHPTQPEDM